MIRLYFNLFFKSIFNIRTLYKILIIFTIGFISRYLVNNFFGVNVFIDFCSYISLIYYSLFSCFVIFIHELVDSFYILPLVVEVLYNNSLTVGGEPSLSCNRNGDKLTSLNSTPNNKASSELQGKGVSVNNVDYGSGHKLTPKDVADKHKLISKGKVQDLRDLNASQAGSNSNVEKRLENSSRTGELKNSNNVVIDQKKNQVFPKIVVLDDLTTKSDKYNSKYKVLNKIKELSKSSRVKVSKVTLEIKNSIKKDVNTTIQTLKVQKKTFMWFLRGGRSK